MAAPGFYNQNANRAYPFLRGSVAQPDDGPLTLRQLPNGVVVDAGFVINCKGRFQDGTHTVYLNKLTRQGSAFYFEFASDAPGLFEIPLIFTRFVSDPDYAVEFVDSGDTGTSSSSISVSMVPGCTEPAWSGFLVTGRLEELELLLPLDGVIERDGGSTVEPALVQNLSETYVTKVGIANADRTRTVVSDGCPDVVFPYPTGGVYIYEPCLIGDLIFVPGYNAVLRQEEQALVFGASVGAGAGEPCGIVPLFEDETPPDGSTLPEGGLRCNELLRSINGVGGRQFEISAGLGVTIAAVPEEHKIIVDVNMFGLVTCFDTISDVSESC